MPSPQTLQRRTLAGNLLLLQELEELLKRIEFPVMLLKGAALIACGLRDAGERAMGDVDLLVRPERREALIAAIEARGFQKYPDDPNQFRKGGLSFDVHDEIWYLDGAEFDEMWRNAGRVSIGEAEALVQRPGDLLLHVLAHACVHHAEADPKWADDARALWQDADVELLRRRVRELGMYAPIARYLAELGLADWPAAKPPLFLSANGHLQRLWYLRGWGFRARRAWKTLFPDARFIKRRYDLKTDGQVRLWRVLRPARLAWSALRAIF